MGVWGGALVPGLPYFDGLQCNVCKDQKHIRRDGSSTLATIFMHSCKDGRPRNEESIALFAHTHQYTNWFRVAV